MSNHAVLTAAHVTLSRLVKEYLEAIEGIPDDDLNHWKPAAEQNGGGEMSPLAGLSVHTALAGTWMIVHQVFGQDFPRDRMLEFTTTSTRAEIEQLFATMLDRLAELTAAEPDIDLAGPPASIRPALPEWDRAAWLFHALDHTGPHLGHAQIHRQLWLAERATH